ncbi:50S ribosomal protein L28 [bacterium]|nr:50S ribosomal protein L28 [bacterium]
MAKKCYFCKRGPQTSFSRSHSARATKRKQYLNLHTIKVNGKRVKICSKCLKKLKKKKLGV